MDRGYISLNCDPSFHEGRIGRIGRKAGDTDLDNDERERGSLDAVVAQLFNSDTEEEKFEGFVDGE